MLVVLVLFVAADPNAAYILFTIMIETIRCEPFVSPFLVVGVVVTSLPEVGLCYIIENCLCLKYYRCGFCSFSGPHSACVGAIHSFKTPENKSPAI